MQHITEAKTATIDAYRSRIAELEHALSVKDDIVAGQRRTLAAANEAREAVLEVSFYVITQGLLSNKSF